jgi:predicted ribosomally synthesized peptide with SipW-like signal peptide
MKKAKKIVALLLCAVLLIGASVAGTLAFLTSKATVTNSFTVGKVVLGEDGKAGLDEAKVDEYGVADSSAARVIENTYKLIPGHTYTKDPTVHVGANSEACWLFVKVENGIADIEAATTTGEGAYTKIAEQVTANGWTLVDGETNIYYKEAAKTGDTGADYVVFGNFRLATNAVVSNYASAKITVTAYAIQKDGLTVTEAWAALEAAYPENP